MSHPTLTTTDFADYNAYLIDTTRARIALARAERRALVEAERAATWALLTPLIARAEQGEASSDERLMGRALCARIRELSAELGISE